MKISEIRDPTLFQRLVQRLYVAERGNAFQIVDDSGGDRGNDGYDAQRGIILSIYCPEKPESADYLRKAKADLAKVVHLSARPGYRITEWWFVTPTELREPVHAELRTLATESGLTASFTSAVHLEDLYRRHPHLRDEFPELEYPLVAAKLSEILDRLPTAETGVQSQIDKQSIVRDAASDVSNSILDGFASAKLTALANRLEQGDETALAELERYRMESLDARDVLSSLLVELQHEQDHSNRDRALQLAQTGLEGARRSKLSAEQSVFAANLALEKALLLVARDIDMVAEARLASLTGMLLMPEDQWRAEEQALRALGIEVDELVREAQSAAELSNNLVALYIVLLRRASIITQRHFPFALSRNGGLSSSAQSGIASMRREMEAVYDAAIRVASALGSEQRLATAYGNYANDLVAFGEYDRATSHARNAIDLARRVNDQIQVGKTELLLEKIRREQA